METQTTQIGSIGVDTRKLGMWVFLASEITSTVPLMLTINIMDYEDHIGLTTLKVRVENQENV